MNKLYHHLFCPFSRQVRIFLKEINIDFELVLENFWEKNLSFIKLNPTGNLPILVGSPNFVISGIYPITEYLNEKYDNFHLMHGSISEKAAIRQSLNWYNEKFYNEVTKIFINEKYIRSMVSNEGPRTEYLRIAKKNLINHIHNFNHSIMQNGNFLVLENACVADIAAASHFSVLDYFNEVNWDAHPALAEWYSLIKSRPSFKPILKDLVPGFLPPKCYTELDF